MRLVDEIYATWKNYKIQLDNGCSFSWEIEPICKKGMKNDSVDIFFLYKVLTLITTKCFTISVVL